MAPACARDSDTAAALGWSVAWTGATRTPAPEHQSAMSRIRLCGVARQSSIASGPNPATANGARRCRSGSSRSFYLFAGLAPPQSSPGCVVNALMPVSNSLQIDNKLLTKNDFFSDDHQNRFDWQLHCQKRGNFSSFDNYPPDITKMEAVVALAHQEMLSRHAPTPNLATACKRHGWSDHARPLARRHHSRVQTRRSVRQSPRRCRSQEQDACCSCAPLHKNQSILPFSTYRLTDSCQKLCCTCQSGDLKPLQHGLHTKCARPRELLRYPFSKWHCNLIRRLALPLPHKPSAFPFFSRTDAIVASALIAAISMFTFSLVAKGIDQTIPKRGTSTPPPRESYLPGYDTVSTLIVTLSGWMCTCLYLRFVVSV
jgi:hypothetical protein